MRALARIQTSPEWFPGLPAREETRSRIAVRERPAIASRVSGVDRPHFEEERPLSSRELLRLLVVCLLPLACAEQGTERKPKGGLPEIDRTTPLPMPVPEVVARVN